jgi:hypothetical protein
MPDMQRREEIVCEVYGHYALPIAQAICRHFVIARHQRCATSHARSGQPASFTGITLTAALSPYPWCAFR